MVAAQIASIPKHWRLLAAAVACAASLPGLAQDVAPSIPDRDFADARSYVVHEGGRAAEYYIPARMWKSAIQDRHT